MDMKVMTALDKGLGSRHSLTLLWWATVSLSTAMLAAQTPAPRIMTEIDNSERATIPGTRPSITNLANDAGRVPPTTRIQGINMVFRRSVAQEAILQSLLAAQQNTASPLYHKWLAPDQFAAQFGVAESDISTVAGWLQQQGFSVDGVSRGKNRITFSGTVEQVAATFGAELRYYKIDGRKYYAPSSDISVPAALSSLVLSVTNLSSFRPRSHVKFRPKFSSSQSGNHYLTPKDVATIYDISAAYTAGYTGSGQSIAIVGQSSISLSDIENFQSAAGLTVKDPTLILVPDSGTAIVSSGDESESDLDLEYSGGIARGASIFFVYVGNNSNYSVWDSINYTVDNQVAPVISTSYGDCETDLGSANYSTLNAVLAQAAAQGQTVIAAAGDSGSTDCYGYTNLTTTQQEALAVDFPASSQYVTGMGGTEFPSADVSSSNTTYWDSASGSDVISSALSYIPEQVWNDDSSSNGLSSGGGGVSTLTARPSWQTGVPGIPSGSYRLVPDISLDASPNNAGYLLCSSDSSATGITGSCSNGFRDSNDQYLTVAGGTSFDAPIFAGMIAIINQKVNSSGQGVVNGTLYKLAANSSTYTSAFHDITSGSNQCTAGSSYCSTSGESDYSATAGYDEASGLGSVDFYNLLLAWPTTTSSTLDPSTVSLSATTTSPASGTADTITITVASGSSAATTTPTGTLTIVVDGTTETPSLALSSGSAIYSFSSSTTGSHIIKASYSGDSTFAASTGTLVLTVGGSSSSGGTFTIVATNVTVSAGSAGTSTVTITPKNGYTGTIEWTVASSASLSNACYSISNTTVSGASAVTASLTIDTSSSACSSSSMKGTNGKRMLLRGFAIVPDDNDSPGPGGVIAAHATTALAGLIFVLILAYRPRKHHSLAGILLILIFGLGLAGCGSSSSSSNAAKGTYSMTITGTDSASASITASTTITLTID
jgi:subtilase family serine protease